MSKIKVFTRTNPLGANAQIKLQYTDGMCKCEIFDLTTSEYFENTLDGDLKAGFKWCMEAFKKWNIGKH